MGARNAAIHSTSKNVAIGEQAPLAGRQIIELRPDTSANKTRPGPRCESCIVDNRAVEVLGCRTTDSKSGTLGHVENTVQRAARPIHGATAGDGELFEGANGG